MKKDIIMKIGLGLAAFVVLILISIPSFALSMNPTDSQGFEQEREPTQEELDQQMSMPKVINSGGPSYHDSYEKSEIEIPEGANSEPESVKAALAESEKRNSDQSKTASEKKANNLLGLAIAFAIVGLLCIGAVLLVKKGPQAPK
ncbi:MAG: hypothetical protein SNJ70_06250 [Armatimonadota bacterium]